jgi:hypothetical protein
MNPDPTSLENLHDIVVPPPVSWWPLAMGWYFVLGFIFIGCMVLVVSRWWQFQRQAYRRAGVKELIEARSNQQISALLRRVAMVTFSRDEVAPLSGEAWPNWLESRARVSMNSGVRQQLAWGVYQTGQSSENVDELKAYAAQWIRQHSVKISSPVAQPDGVQRGAASC